MFVYMPPGIWAFCTIASGAGVVEALLDLPAELEDAEALAGPGRRPGARVAASRARSKSVASSGGSWWPREVEDRADGCPCSGRTRRARPGRRAAGCRWRRRPPCPRPCPGPCGRRRAGRSRRRARPGRPTRRGSTVSTMSTPATMAISIEATPRPGVQCVWRSTGRPVSALSRRTRAIGPRRVDEAGHVLDRDHVRAERGEGSWPCPRSRRR